MQSYRCRASGAPPPPPGPGKQKKPGQNRVNSIDFLQDECKLGLGGRLGYIDAISELIDFRKVNGASNAVLRNLSATELYLKKARKTVAKMMRLQWTQDMDIETLETRVSLGNNGGNVRSRDVSLASL